MRIQNINLNLISIEKTLRKDYDFHSYNLQTTNNYIKFDELFSIVSSEIDLSAFDGPFQYCEIGDVTKNGDSNPVSLNFSNRLIEDYDYYKKIEKGDIISVDKDDILLSKVRPNLRKYVRITDENQKYFYTSAFIRLKPKKLPSILYYCFRTVFYNDLMAIARQGKGYPTINEKDLKTLKFKKSIIDALELQEEKILSEIAIVESLIEEKNKGITPICKIIDTILCENFAFNYKKFNELKTVKLYSTTQNVYSNNPDLRFSAKFHRPAGEYVEKELRRIGKKRFKHYLAEPIILGASISPTDCCEDGEFCYISMATIKTWEFNKDSANIVSDDYAEAKKEKRVKKNDIILARSGEGTIGKVALIEDDVDAIFCDFTMRIRLKNYNPKFAYYYMRSTYFQYLVEIYKKGLGNNTNIFPVVVQEFPLPDISLDEQQKIVDTIQAEIDKQNEIRNQIAALRGKIDSIIESAILSKD